MAPDPTHVYVHVPFCAHRCGYCDFVTVTGSEPLHERYVEALLRELAAVGAPDRVDTVFVGGGTPSLLADPLLRRLLAGLPAADELTVECNPETVTPHKARVLVEGGVIRVSLGAQSFRPHLLATLERLATPETVRAAVRTLRTAGVQSLNLDLIFGVPGEDAADLDADLDDLLALEPDHISAYELEAKPGTRFTHAHGAELARQADLIEGHYERVVERLTDAGYRWYETANFCRPGHEARHNLGYWTGHDYLGVGVGAVSTIGLERRRVRPSLPRYLAAVEAGETPPVEVEHLTPGERATERVMLGLRLDRPFATDAAGDVIDLEEANRLARAGLVELANGTIRLTDRGRFLTNSVLAAILR
jgi:putative oxygen-independent coproporphyrinogen III oxidase